MSYYDEPMEYEPQEHDELAIKVLELIKTEVSAKIGETVTSLEQARANESRLYAKVNLLETKIRDFSNETKKVLLEKEREVKREIFEGFTIGDVVYYANTKVTSVPCTTCGGTRKLIVSMKGSTDEIKIDCNKCNYDGKNHTYTSHVYKSTIRSVHLEMNDKNKWLTFYLVADDRERKIESIFKKEDECQAHCDEQNKPKVEVAS